MPPEISYGSPSLRQEGPGLPSRGDLDEMGKHSSSWGRIDASRRARWLAPALILGLVAIVLLLIWINSRNDLSPWQ